MKVMLTDIISSKTNYSLLSNTSAFINLKKMFNYFKDPLKCSTL